MDLRNLRSLSLVLAAGLSAFSGACTGILGESDEDEASGSGGDGDRSGPGGDGDGGTPFETGEATPAPLRMRRLTRVEYNDTVRDLLGDSSQPASAFPVDDSGEVLLNNVASSVNTLFAERYRAAAEALSEKALSENPALIPCSSPTPDQERDCASEFVSTFGRLAFRRPLAEEELSGLLGVFDSVYADIGQTADFETRIRVVLATILQSPSFLYRPEIGIPSPDDPTIARLDDYELATRLSYMLWASAPDAALLDEAARGALATTAGVETTVRSMMANPKFADGVKNFHVQWLGLDGLPELTKDPAVFPEFGDESRAELESNFASFVAGVVVDGDGLLSTLLTQPAGGAATERAGFLTHPAFLAVHATPTSSSPIKRGVAIRHRVLCQHIPEPPDGIPQLPERIPGQTTRERFATHTADPKCASCHNLIDPIGFGLENYDGLGRYRTEEDGLPIDNVGSLFDAGEVEGDFSGGIELSQILSQSRGVADCATDVWLQFGLGAAPDDLTHEQLADLFADSGFNIRDLIVAITTSDAFRYGRIQ